MPEPTATAAAPYAIATGVITLTGSFIGLQYDLLLFGLFGGLVSLMHLGAMSSRRMSVTLVIAAVLGALAAPLLYAMLMYYASWMARVNVDAAQRAMACAVGIGAQVGIPLALAFLRRRVEAANPPPPREG